MIRLSRPYPLNFFKGCLPQILLGSFLYILSHLRLSRFPDLTKYFQSLLNYPTLISQDFYFLQEQCKQNNLTEKFIGFKPLGENCLDVTQVLMQIVNYC